MSLVEGQYLTSPQTLTENGSQALQLDNQGNLKTTNSFGVIVNPSNNFTRPADTTAYAVGDLVANSTTAGSVVPLSWTAARTSGGNFFVRRARLYTSSTSITNSNFRLHLYTSSPVPVNGDNAAWSTPVSGWVGALDITVNEAFSDGAAGVGVPNNGSEIGVALSSGTTLYGLVEARAAYTPTSAEVITVALEVYQ